MTRRSARRAFPLLPPRCISGLRFETSGATGSGTRKKGLFRIYPIACACGQRALRLFGHPPRESTAQPTKKKKRDLKSGAVSWISPKPSVPDFATKRGGKVVAALDAPYHVECRFCGKTHCLFNPVLDGYNGELQLHTHREPIGPPKPWNCPQCADSVGEITLVFGYGYELDDEFGEYDPDYFDSLAIHLACAGCQTSTRVVFHPCA
ncbi:MAG: hypothetical protein U1D30_23695 [Planctomycetota bacterium]